MGRGQAAEHRVHRRDHDVVLVVAEAALSLGGEQPDDGERNLAEAHPFAHRRGLAEEFARHGLAEQSDLGARTRVALAEGLARHHLPVAHREVVRRDSEHLSRPVARAGDGLGAGPHHRRDPSQQRRVGGQALGVVESQRGRRSGAALHAAELRRARHHGEHVATEAGDLALDALLRASPDRDHHDDRGDADDDAQGGEETAQAIAADRTESGDEEPAEELHRLLLGGATAQFGGARAGVDRVVDRTIGADTAVGEHHPPPGATRDVLLVGHQHDRGPAAIELLEQRQDLHRGRRVEIAGRFVGEQDRRPVDQGARDRHSLLLTAGQLSGS